MIKNPMLKALFLVIVSIATLPTVGFSQLVMVNFNGLSNEGGTFSTGIDGNPVDPITVSRLAVDNAVGGGQTVLSDNTTVKMHATELNNLPVSFTTTLSFTAPTEIQLTFGSDSNLTSSTVASITFNLQNASTGTIWNFADLTNATIVYSNNDTTAVLTPTSDTDAVEFNLLTDAFTPTTGIEMTVTSKANPTEISANFSVSMPSTETPGPVVPEPSTVWLAGLGMTALLLGARKAQLRFQR